MKPEIVAASLFATLTLVAAIGWSLSCVVPIEVETTRLQIVSATVNGESVDLARYQRDRAPTLEAGWAQNCEGGEQRAVVWIGSDDEATRVTFIAKECGGSP